MALLSTSLKKAAREKFRNRIDEHRMESLFACLNRRKLFWGKRIEYYEGRVKALEQRTRYDRIRRTPVI